mmetsp:Transcript_26863/g.45128  ORF Transcript_26863/g.45128 Transcript_26863/m.45128 type:complete len:94 (-) Transcript_26863:1172-1453(-)
MIRKKIVSILKAILSVNTVHLPMDEWRKREEELLRRDAALQKQNEAAVEKLQQVVVVKILKRKSPYLFAKIPQRASPPPAAEQTQHDNLVIII